MQAYASVGDVDGMEIALERYENMGYQSTTESMNIVLKSVVCSPGTTWEYLKETKESLFGPDRFVPNSETYVQLLIACEIFGRIDDAILWFYEARSTGVEITSLMKNIYRQIIESENLNKNNLKLNIWENEGEIKIREGTTNDIDYNSIWGMSIKRTVDNGQYDDYYRVPLHLVNGIDHDIIKIQKIYGSEINTFKRLINERITKKQKVSINLLNNLMNAFVRQGQYEEAKKIFHTDINLFKLKPDLQSVEFILPAYSNTGDHVGCEQILSYVVDNKIPVGEN